MLCNIGQLFSNTIKEIVCTCILMKIFSLQKLEFSTYHDFQTIVWRGKGRHHPVSYLSFDDRCCIFQSNRRSVSSSFANVPSLVNCCTIDWFSAWPDEALRSVASTFLGEIHELEDSGTTDGLVSSSLL